MQMMRKVRIGKKRFFGLMKYDKAGGAKCPKRINGAGLQHTGSVMHLNIRPAGDSEDIFGSTKCYKTDPTRIRLGWTVKVNNCSDFQNKFMEG